jgi:glucose/mannose-6-phosphate isomerase
MADLDQFAVYEQQDKQQMRSVLETFPEQCEVAVQLGERFKISGIEAVEKVVICGMGGSAMAGELAQRFARIPLFVNRNYRLPSFVDRATLLVAASYSGNTDETVSSLAEGLKRKLPIVCVSSGGRIETFAKKHFLPFLSIPTGYQPRMAMGYLALPLLVLLRRLDLVKELDSLGAVVSQLKSVRSQCGWKVRTEGNLAKELAKKACHKVPLIYGTVGNTDLVAMRWKTQINENAKQAAFWNVFPELSHNEISSFTKPDLLAGFFPMLLRNAYDGEENVTRIRLMEALFEQRSIPHSEVHAEGKTELAQIFSQIYFGDYLSFYLALLNQVDPTPVGLIEKFKRDLRTKLNTPEEA